MVKARWGRPSTLGIEHSLRVDFFQRGGDRALELWVDGPGIGLRRVPSGWFFRPTGP